MNLRFYGKEKNNKISSILVESSSGEKILLDCGIQPSNMDQSIIPRNEIKEISGIFLTHAHLDHWGYLPYLIEGDYNNSIFMTTPTYDLLESYAFKEYFNHLTNMSKEVYQKVVHKIRDLIQTRKYGQLMELRDFYIHFLPANHILGSAQILLEEKQTKIQILYTGDFNPANNFLFEPIYLKDLINKFKLDIKPKIVITESSNVNLTGSEYLKQEEIFINTINKTYQNLGNVLIPSKALGNAQEFLFRYLYYCLNKDLYMPKEIFTLGSLVEVNKVYLNHKNQFKNPKLIELFKVNMIIKDFKAYLRKNFSNMEDLYFENKRDYGIKLFIATGGNLKGGSSKRVFNMIKDNQQNLIITNKMLKELKCKAKILNLDIFSLHGDFESIQKYILDISKKNEAKILLIHGFIQNINKLKKFLDHQNITNKIPKVGDLIKVGE
ncbi:MAG: MBL fold metallo-hydrolase [Candidatus Lokiarchaeota archaeon]